MDSRPSCAHLEDTALSQGGIILAANRCDQFGDVRSTQPLLANQHHGGPHRGSERQDLREIAIQRNQDALLSGRMFEDIVVARVPHSALTNVYSIPAAQAQDHCRVGGQTLIQQDRRHAALM